MNELKANELKAKVYDLFIERGKLMQRMQEIEAAVLELEKEIDSAAKDVPEKAKDA